MKAYIKTIDYYLPEKIVTNEDLTHDFPEWSIDKIIAKVGVKTRHIAADDETAADLAIAAIAKNMAVDLSGKNIRVNCVLPGQVETPLIHGDAITQEQLEADMRLYPLKRYGKPEEIAYAIIYLLSDASSWVTGSNLVIDGGFTLL